MKKYLHKIPVALCIVILALLPGKVFWNPAKVSSSRQAVKPADAKIRNTTSKDLESALTDTKQVSVKNTKSKSAKSKSKKISHRIIKKDGKLYLVNKKGKKAAGWFVKVGDDYKRLGSIDDIGLYKSKSFKIIRTNTKGILTQNDTIDEFHFNKKGVLSGLSGLYKIRGKWYFLKNGRLKITDQKYKKAKYFVRLNGTVYSYRKKGKMYTPAGKKMSDIERRDIGARLYARERIKEFAKKGMSKSQKLQKAFQWVVHNYSYVDIPCKGEKGWTSKIGISLLRRGIGDCRGLATGFVYLATELGYKESYLCQDCKNVFSGSHCWASINGKYYDPLFYNTKKPRRYLPVFNGSTPQEYQKKTHCSVSQKFKAGD